MVGNNLEEEVDNELYVIMMQKMSKYLNKTHPKQCNEKCGCHPPNRKNKIDENNFLNMRQTIKINF